MKEIPIEKFKESCLKGFCYRRTMYNKKTCITDFKQNTCYGKYLKQIGEDQKKMIDRILKSKEDSMEITVDLKYEELKRAVWLRDSGKEYDGVSKKKNWQEYCIFWNNIMSPEDQRYLIINFSQDLWLNESLDLMHIESIGRNSEEKYNIDNVVLVGRLFHSRIDQFKNPVTNEDMTNDERNFWLQKLKNYVKEIGE